MAETRQPADLKPAKGPDWWRKELHKSCKGKWGQYVDAARKVIDRYRNEEKQPGKFNILYSNVETLRPAIYSRVPQPDVRRRWSQSDPVGRAGAQVLQKALIYCADECGLGEALYSVAQDFVLPCFAVARVLYVPYVSKDGSAVEYEETKVEHVGWDKFSMSRSKSWDRVWWVAFAHDLTRAEYSEKFGKKAIDAAKFTFVEAGDADSGDEETGVARVWEVWDKRAKQRLWVAQDGGMEWVKEPEPDPLGLEGFFPVPKPLWAISTTGSIVPVIEYRQYQQQALELEDLTDRITVLTSALRRRGVYAAELKDMLASVIKGTGDNQFAPVSDWAALMDKGGLEKVIHEMPLDGIIKALGHLYQAREQVIQVIYQVTGMADIVRGSSNPNETATAQQIKGRWAGVRLSERQGKFQAFCRDLLRLQGEIIAERFEQKTLALMSGMELPTMAERMQAQQVIAQAQQIQAQAQQLGQQVPPQLEQQVAMAQKAMQGPTWEDVIAVLRSDKLRGFRVDIETDSTIQPDADEERQQRVDVLTSATVFLGTSAPLVQQGLMPKKLADELLLFALRGFKMGPQIETLMEQLGESDQLPPNIQKAQQAVQAKEKELQQRESAIKAAEDQAAKQVADARLAQERSARAEDQAKFADQVLRLNQSFMEKLNALEVKHDADMQRLAGDAESAVTAAITEAMQGMPVGGGGGGNVVERMPAQKAGPTNVNIKIAGKGVKLEEPKKPRRLRIADQPDGSTLIEEIQEEVAEAVAEAMGEPEREDE